MNNVTTTLRPALLAGLIGLLPFAVTAAELLPVPQPPLGQTEAAVRTQLETSRGELDRLRAQPGVPPAELAQAFAKTGMLYLNYGFLAAAEPSLTNAQSLEPDNYRWPYYLGLVLLEQGNLEGAAQHFMRVLALRDGDLPTVLRLADVFRQLNRTNEARQLYESALQSPLGRAAGHAGLGRIALDAGEPQAAIEHLQAALQEQPDANSLAHPLGLAYRQLGDLEKARPLLEQRGQNPVLFPDPLQRAVDALGVGAGARIMAGALALQAKDLKGAEAAYRDAVTAQPASVEARQGLATALAEQGNVAGAIAEYQKLLADQPDQPRILYSLGTLYAQQGNLTAAIPQLQRAVELQPDFAEAWLGLGEALAQKGEVAVAAQRFAKAVELDPNSTQARLRLSRTLRFLGQNAAADEALKVLLERDPGNLDGLLLLAQNLIQDRQFEPAQARLQQVLASPQAAAPQLAQAHFLLGQAEPGNGQPEQEVAARAARIAHYRQALVQGPRHSLALFNLATDLAAAGEVKEAIQQFRTLLEVTPKDQTARYRFALLLAAQGENWEALAQFETLRQQNPEHLEFWVRCAHLMAALGDDSAAEQRLKEALTQAKTAEDRSRLYSQLGVLAEKKGAVEPALAHFREGVRSAPDFPPAQRALAEALGRAQRYADAVLVYDQYLTQVPQDEDAHFARVMALLWTQQEQKARAALESGMKALPQSLTLAHLMARLLALASDPGVRDGERALALAAEIFKFKRDPAYGETVAMSLAALGRFEEALSWQKRLLAEAQQSKLPADFVARVRDNLARYEAGQPAQAAW